MTEASRLSTTAVALRDALGALADALAQARPEALAASETTIEACVREFRDAAAASLASRDELSRAHAMALDAALRRCRRLGDSLSQLAGSRTPPPDSPHGYTPVGKPVPRGGEGSFLTARV
jgi:hypothetical protein